MASLTKRKSGSWFIRWATPAGEKTLSIGNLPRRSAESVLTHVHHLLAAVETRSSVPPATMAWCDSIGDDLHRRLAGAGLVPSRERITILAALDAFCERRTDVKASTQTVYQRTRNHVAAYFGESKELAEVTEGDAVDFRAWMLRPKVAGGAGLRRATTGKHVAICALLWKDAIRRRLVTTNPWQGVPTTVGASIERMVYVDRSTMARVLDACPDARWRAIFCLARFGGLRCPSEVLSLTWDHVDWSNRRLRVPSPKTADVGKPYRVIPLFPEVETALLDLYTPGSPGSDAGGPGSPGTDRIIDYPVGTNLGVLGAKIVARAAVEPWPKVFQNLRASFATDVARNHPSHIAGAWCGHTAKVAQAHYLMVGDDDFERALAMAEDASKEAAHVYAHVRASAGSGTGKHQALGDWSEGVELPTLSDVLSESVGIGEKCLIGQSRT